MTSCRKSLNVIRTLFLLGFFSVVNGQLGTSTVFLTATGTPSSTSTPLSSPTSAADPGVVTFYLPSPFFVGDAAVPVTTIASVSLVGSGVSDGVAYTTFIEERVIEVPATTSSADFAVGTPVPGSTTTITGTMVANSQGWTFNAPDYNNYRENCSLSGSQGVQLACSYQFSSGVGLYGGNALAEYTLTLSTSTPTATPSGTGSSAGSGSGSSGTGSSGSGSSNTSSSSSKNGSNSHIGGYSMAGGFICMLSVAFLSAL